MPLAERDVNTQRQRPLTRGKRLHTAASVTDENTAPPLAIARPQETPTRQQRFFTPTKASAAKNTPPPAIVQPRTQPHSGRSTPHSQQQSSKIPRRNLATPATRPAYDPPISRWNLTAASNLNSRSERDADSLPASPCPPTALETAHDRSLGCRVPGHKSSLYSHVEQIAHESFTSTHRRARVDKPLPSRPIASLAYAPSPSRNSRSLMDASERPLRLSVAGSERDWPTLIPTPQSTQTLSSPPEMADVARSSARLSAGASSIPPTPEAIDSQTNNGKHIHGDLDLSRASIISYITTSEAALDAESPDTSWQETSCQTPDIDVSDNKSFVRPPRNSSLTTPQSISSPIERSQNTGPQVSGSSNFARDIFEASRPHSPSPASFSRPRPTSFSQIASIMSPPVASTESTPAQSAKSQKTASRIPLPDQKKATLVDIKSRRISGIPIPKFDRGLSFGGRRIDSPDPLKVLDHGIKRRQLQRANTGGSSSTASTVPTRLLGTNTPPVDRSKANTPDSTMGSTSEEEEEITTPSGKPTHFVKHGYKPKHVSRASGSHYAGATLKVYDEAEVVLGRPPPSNSPFTGPLQTIPSQSTLPLQATFDRDSLEQDSQPKVVIKPTEFSAFAQRLSVLEDSRDLFAADRYNRASLIGSGTKSELVDLLREAEHEDALISQCGARGLDEVTKAEITNTLGMLEGRCGPTDSTANLDHLSRMFGRLKTGFEKAPKSAAFVEDATVAERFLARQESLASKASNTNSPDNVEGIFATPPTAYKDDDAASQLSRSKTVASKWSSSTASAKDYPLPFTSTTSRPNTFGMEFNDVPPTLPPKHLANGKPKSIGYPSRTPGKAHRLLGTDERDIGPHKTATRRESSPTLGTRIPGSVRAAREKARDAAGSRVNKASTTKVEKLLTSNTRVIKLSEDAPRGRLSYAEKPGNRSSTKLPRSRSKSRYVFDKINGLFSGRRDKRDSQLPPVPPIKDSLERERLIPASKEVRINSLGSPLLKDARVPPLTKMPTISPPVDKVHPALHGAPSSMSVAPNTAAVGSNADYDGRRSLQGLSEKILGRALKEGDPAKKERLLSFAKVLNDSLISAREAQISAETAQTAAHSAQLSYEMTMKSVAMLHRLASGMNRR